MKKLSLFLFLAICTFSTFSQNFSVKQGGNCYSLTIPDYMTKTWDLNDAASLQYKNITKEAYVIVIEDDKDQLESLGMKFINSKDFLENFIKDYNTDVKKRKVSDISEFAANGNGHSQLEFTWEKEDLKFYMLITVVETKSHFYKILTWTLLENKDKLKNDFQTISKSLKD